MKDDYTAPSLTVVGSVHGTTLQNLDKIGSQDDMYTKLISTLDGEVQPD